MTRIEDLKRDGLSVRGIAAVLGATKAEVAAGVAGRTPGVNTVGRADGFDYTAFGNGAANYLSWASVAEDGLRDAANDPFDPEFFNTREVVGADPGTPNGLGWAVELVKAGIYTVTLSVELLVVPPEQEGTWSLGLAVTGDGYQADLSALQSLQINALLLSLEVVVVNGPCAVFPLLHNNSLANITPSFATLWARYVSL